MAGTLDWLVGQQTIRTPEAVAVRAGDGQATYRELDRAVQSIAVRLIAAGTRPGDAVGVFMPRSWRLPAALLGVLRTGAAYVPLDPLYPPARIEFMLRDAGVHTIVTDSAYCEQARRFGCALVAADAGGSHGATVESHSTAGGLAYVIYTSGSSGAPKGVEIPHAALTSFVGAILERPGLSASDRILAVTTVCFDIAVLELLVPLTIGATVIVAPEDTVRDGRLLQDLIERERATVLQATPALWRLLLDSGAVLGRDLRLFCGGEALTAPLARRLLDRGGELWNLYGPTEATVWCAAHRVDRTDEGVPIGLPLPGYDMAILDASLAPVPDGGEGEICIAGHALARGYRNRPDLTSSRFVPAGGRVVYRTGDLGRRRQDGAFECLGRIDEQIKIDGFRVEPGEIEQVLERHPAIARAVVALSTAAETPHLAAYLLAADGAGLPSVAELRALLQGVIPAYMVPSTFVRLRALPLTANGKVDRKRLVECSEGALQDAPRRTSGGSFVEQRLRLIWCELLSLDDVGPRDDFFALGGRSLTAATLFVRIEEDFGVRLPIATLLRAPTVSSLAGAIEDGVASMAWDPLVCLQPRGAGPPIFLVHPLGGNVITYRPLVAHLGDRHPIWGLQARGLDGREAPHRTIEAMAADYLAEIARVWTGPCAIAGASFGGLVAFAMASELERRGAVVRALLLDTECPDAAWTAAAAYRRSPWFRVRVYPQLQRVRGHVRALRSQGPRGYWASVAARSPQRQAAVVDDDRDRDRALPGPLSRVSAANERAARLFLPPVCRGQLTLFRASDPRRPPDRRDDWRRVAPQLREVTVPGNHRSMRVEHADALARAILEEMEFGAGAAGSRTAPPQGAVAI